MRGESLLAQKVQIFTGAPACSLSDAEPRLELDAFRLKVKLNMFQHHFGVLKTRIKGSQKREEKRKIPPHSSWTIYPSPTHFTQTIERMWNLTSEAWIFWHLFFTVGMVAVIAFEGSLIHLHCTLLPRVGNMIGIWHMSSFHLLLCRHSLCGDVCLGRTLLLSLGALRDGRLI